MRLQQGFPLVKRPFGRLARELGLSEEECMSRTRRLMEKGYLASIRPVVDAAAAGYKSCLVAMNVEKDSVAAVAEAINKRQEVTHNYLRKAELNLWFTFTYESEQVKEACFSALRRMKGVRGLLELPSEKTYKIGLVLAV